MAPRASFGGPWGRVDPALLLVIAVGLAVRCVLSFVVFPARGFAGDLDLFVAWSKAMLEVGPGHVYSATAGTGSVVYPPGSLWLLGGIRVLATLVTGGHGVDVTVAELVKLPTALADAGSAALVAHLVGRVASRRTALVATAVTVALPSVLYDQSVWGQFDSLLLCGSLAALALLIDGHPVAATATATVVLLVKPQGVLVLLVVAVAVVGEAIARRRIRPLLAAVAVGAAVLMAGLLPFDLQRFAPGAAAHVPVVGQVVGFVVQSLGSASLYPVLTANAYNGWALVGDPSLAAGMGTRTVTWWGDRMTVLGIPASTIGAVSLGVVVVIVVVGLLLRPDRTAVLLAFALLGVAFFTLPTRSHERYLVPVFGVLVVLAAGTLWRMLAVVALSIVSTLNLHGVLTSTARIVWRGATRPAGDAGVAVATQASLPWGWVARLDGVVTACVLVSCAVTAALLIAFVVLVLRRPVTTART